MFTRVNLTNITWCVMWSWMMCVAGDVLRRIAGNIGCKGILAGHDVAETN